MYNNRAVEKVNIGQEYVQEEPSLLSQVNYRLYEVQQQLEILERSLSLTVSRIYQTPLSDSAIKKQTGIEAAPVGNLSSINDTISEITNLLPMLHDWARSLNRL